MKRLLIRQVRASVVDVYSNRKRIENWRLRRTGAEMCAFGDALA